MIGGFVRRHLSSLDALELDELEAILEMLDVVNEQLTLEGKEPIAFEHDCREGICGTCGTMVNGRAHGQLKGTTLCQLHMRHLAEDPSFKDGSTITIEPWRSTGFPVLRDLIVDRSALDRIIQAGGYISVNTGAAPEAHAAPVQKEKADAAGEKGKVLTDLKPTIKKEGEAYLAREFPKLDRIVRARVV